MEYEIINRKEFLLKKGTHRKDSLIIVLEGSFRCIINNNEYFINKNDIFSFKKGVCFEREVLQELTCLYLQFEGFSHEIESGILKISDRFRCENTIKYLKSAILKNDLTLINHYVIDIFLLENNNPKAINYCNDKLVFDCIDYICKNYDTLVNLEILSKKFTVSKQWLISRFKNCTGKTPIAFLNEVRIQNAKMLLSDTYMAINDIAFKCGFENQYYFSNYFKKYTGVSPSVYRKNSSYNSL